MNAIIDKYEKYTVHTIENAEFTGVYDLMVHAPSEKPTDNPYGFICNYHFYIKYGDKVYVDVIWVGEIVISFAELQKNQYLKHHYDLSLLLTNDKDKNVVIEYNKDDSEHHTHGQYGKKRFWSFNTAYPETSFLINNIMNTNGSVMMIKNFSNKCYYKINPYDLVNMEYSSQEELNTFNNNYMLNVPEIVNKVFNNMYNYYNNIAIDYNIKIMEKEIEELSEIFQDKKNLINLVALSDKEGMNSDVLTTIYKYLVSSEGNLRYNKIINKLTDCKNKLEINTQILSA
uniref:Uncharacterized protein n=1 Tax=viral metagenome TaxID=1070528 RepID=A0A6C0LDE8_9ZZZZ